MKNLGIKIISISVILLFCLSPLGAIDFNQGDNATHINIDNDSDIKDIKDINNTIDVVDIDKNKTVNETDIELDEDIKKDIVSENKSDSSKKLKNADVGLSIEIDDVYEDEWPFVYVRTNDTINDYMVVRVDSPDGIRLDAIMNVVKGEGTLYLNKTYWRHKLEPGTYTASIIFEGDDTYNPSITTTTFEVFDHKREGG